MTGEELFARLAEIPEYEPEFLRVYLEHANQQDAVMPAMAGMDPHLVTKLTIETHEYATRTARLLRTLSRLPQTAAPCEEFGL